ncbi:DUF2156 domain-containing protein [Entomomonas sp. E2T0]|uniref:DUF2156 domain-containing protein n=1 Tax=Entomomonas sp. E2T0 TaxID=2930213 RepID=UPI0022281B59|nr:DUF2156 domain-containing protein [Entomomonas sp. E2T0]UYZ84930.1 DUF2156 domain-containing protein [Entomomonas sp. E2T0]
MHKTFSTLLTNNAQEVNQFPSLKTALEHSTNSLSCLLLNKEVNWFTNDYGAIGFFKYKNMNMCIGGILSSEENKQNLLSKFLEFNKAAKTFPIFLHFSESDFNLLKQYGFNINQLGASYSLSLENYTIEGKSFQQLRNKINKAKKKGIVVKEIFSQQKLDLLKPQLEFINTLWLKNKGGNALSKLVIDFNSIELNSGEHRLYIASIGDNVLAYIIYTRTYGKTLGWFHNLSRRIPDAPNGIMQLINQTAINQFKKENQVAYLHFGFTPLVEFENTKQINDSFLFYKVAKWLASKGGGVYPAASQRQYKVSWRPSMIEPELVAFPKGKVLKTLWFILRATNSI